MLSFFYNSAVKQSSLLEEMSNTRRIDQCIIDFFNCGLTLVDVVSHKQLPNQSSSFDEEVGPAAAAQAVQRSCSFCQFYRWPDEWIRPSAWLRNDALAIQSSRANEKFYILWSLDQKKKRLCSLIWDSRCRCHEKTGKRKGRFRNYKKTMLLSWENGQIRSKVGRSRHPHYQ